MRFVFVDRIVAVDLDRTIETLKNVSASEDVFTDHFPGYPILPGALIVEAFVQATQLLIALTYDFDRVGRLRGVSRASFRRFVRPGDQLRLRCQHREGGEGCWVVSASATVAGQTVAAATLEFAIEGVETGADSRERAGRLRELVQALGDGPIDRLTRGLPA